MNYCREKFYDAGLKNIILKIKLNSVIMLELDYTVITIWVSNNFSKKLQYDWN